MAHQFFFNPYILDNLPAPRSGFDVVQDVSEPRLRMYITSHGIKTFFVRKRINGCDRRVIIGKYPDMDIEDARSAVQSVLDVAMQKPIVRRKKLTFRQVLDLYLENRVRRGEDSKTKLIRAINRHFVQLFDKNICDITVTDARAVIDAISGAAIAARMQELMQSVFKYAVQTGYLKNNPISDLPKIPQHRRTRPLNRSGMQRLIAAIRREPSDVFRAAFLMLIYGFAPRSRVFSMQWEELDFNQYMWRDMPLSDAAVVLLQDLPQYSTFWVFPGRGSHLTDPRTAWRRVVNMAGIPNLTMDDVNKFMMRNLIWAPDKEDLRANMNALIEEITSSDF
ncbi:MAG: integrase family protein [Alphaproteobacteria bacterium]|nr:integrase family protein [Alphaproteobacteria bacterium]